MSKTTIKTDSESINRVKDYVRREADNYKTIYEKIYTIVGEIFTYEQWLGEDAYDVAQSASKNAAGKLATKR